MAKFLPVDDFWKTARELTMGLWNRLEKKGVQWMERDQTWYDGVSALAKLCRSDQEQRRFKYWGSMGLIVTRNRSVFAHFECTVTGDYNVFMIESDKVTMSHVTEVAR